MSTLRQPGKIKRAMTAPVGEAFDLLDSLQLSPYGSDPRTHIVFEILYKRAQEFNMYFALSGVASSHWMYREVRRYCREQT